MHEGNSLLQLGKSNEIYTDLLPNSNQSEAYFKKMVEIKDKNIDDLLRELRETKQIYQQYKNQYLNQQKKMKAKLLQVNAKLDCQNLELEKYQQMSAKLKTALQSSTERQKRLAEACQKQAKQFKNTLSQIETKNRQFLKENGIMHEKQSMLQEKCSKLEERLKAKTDEARFYEDECRRIREELLKREEQWRAQKKVLIEKNQQQIKKKAAKDKTNTRLDALQHKIKSTLMKI